MTKAEEVAKLLGDNGDQFETDDEEPISMAQLAKDRGATIRSAGPVDPPTTAWDFPDGSSIVIAGAWWDLGIGQSCFCWDGCGHKEPCPLA